MDMGWILKYDFWSIVVCFDPINVWIIILIITISYAIKIKFNTWLLYEPLINLKNIII
jgi:hypothetical protein